MPGTAGMFRITEWCARNVEAKRKRKGLGELKPRKKNPMRQILVNSFTLTIANFAIAPLERCRILLQTAPMSTYKYELKGSTRAIIPNII